MTCTRVRLEIWLHHHQCNVSFCVCFSLSSLSFFWVIRFPVFFFKCYHLCGLFSVSWCLFGVLSTISEGLLMWCAFIYRSLSRTSSKISAFEHMVLVDNLWALIYFSNFKFVPNLHHGLVFLLIYVWWTFVICQQALPLVFPLLFCMSYLSTWRINQHFIECLFGMGLEHGDLGICLLQQVWSNLASCRNPTIAGLLTELVTFSCHSYPQVGCRVSCTNLM